MGHCVNGSPLKVALSLVPYFSFSTSINYSRLLNLSTLLFADDVKIWKTIKNKAGYFSPEANLD